MKNNLILKQDDTFMPLELSVVIPAYNEANAVSEVVKKTHAALSDIPELLFEIIVVDDGSSDNTSLNVPTDICKLKQHPKNYGYGRTLLTGISTAKYPYIGIIDADSTYDPTVFKEMIPLMEIYDMVIGARKIKKQSSIVKALRLFLKTLLLYFSGHNSLDPNSGIRIFKKSLVESGGHLFSKGFSFSTSLTFFAALNHKFIEYIPINYSERVGSSKVRHVRDSTRTFLLIMSMSLVFRPVKCFAFLLFSYFAGILSFLSLRARFSNETQASSLHIWSVSFLTLAISFLAFIEGKKYEYKIISTKK